MNYRTSFKKFGGEKIPDIIEYLKAYLEKNPNTTISIGVDSIQKKTTIYAITIVLHDKQMRDGAHVVFFREKLPKIRNNDERLQKEALYAYELSEFLHNELKSFYKRSDLTLYEKKRYKFHLLKCEGKYLDVPVYSEEFVISNLSLTDVELNEEFKLVDIHVDFNPFENTNGRRGRNKSYDSFKANVPWIRGFGFRVFSKPLSYSSSCSADFLLKD
jgi:predicted RNase H-related nuclease YkuK (DUF458 family)